MAEQKVIDADFNKKSSTGLEPKIACLLAYIFSWLGGLIIYILEKENKFVKFHALQALIIGILEVLCIIVISISVILGWIPYIGWFLFSWLGYLAAAGCWVFAIIALVKAFGGERYYIPFLRGLMDKFYKE